MHLNENCQGTEKARKLKFISIEIQQKIHQQLRDSAIRSGQNLSACLATDFTPSGRTSLNLPRGRETGT